MQTDFPTQPEFRKTSLAFIAVLTGLPHLDTVPFTCVLPSQRKWVQLQANSLEDAVK